VWLRLEAKPGQTRQRIADDRALAPNEQHHLRKDAKFARPRLFAVFKLISNSKRDRRIWEMLLFPVQFRFGSCVTSIAGPHGDAQLYWR